ncbi:MAG: Bifunctional adenosylcobalamin biosynthesis protein CobP [Syntrophorhabdus sp. PtaU1.Bin050]|nr:MAG: Bifunctional adenosylcobalamin biosynthesis protein CobP [Syntrophorhabdus sp. PtaU1.Bin050]
MRKIVLIVGGARSGKSTFALKEGSAAKGAKAFVATADILDEEMRIRIENHKRQRGKEWNTYEEPLRLAALVEKIRDKYDVILIDCLTLWMSNIMHADLDIEEEINRLLSAITSRASADLYLVSNEVGMGLVPDSPLGRAYRDNLGHLNQEIAQVATDVYFMVAGVVLRIKGENREDPPD